MLFNCKKLDELKKKIEELKDQHEELKNKIEEQNTKIIEYSNENKIIIEKMLFYKEINMPDRQCCVCMENYKNFINISCGHLSVCKDCSQKIEKKCPLCKKDGKFIRVYQ